MALKSTHKLDGAVLSFSCKDDEGNGEFSRSVDLGKLFGVSAGLALVAIAFAARTALRNATGGQTLDDAESNVDARIAAWENGEWGAERASGEGAPITAGNVLAKAVARVYAAKFADAAAAAAALSAMVEQTLSAAGHPAFADLDEENQKKARNEFIKAAKAKDAKIAAAVAAITAEQAAARAAKTAKAAGDSTTSLF